MNKNFSNTYLCVTLFVEEMRKEAKKISAVQKKRYFFLERYKINCRPLLLSVNYSRNFPYTTASATLFIEVYKAREMKQKIEIYKCMHLKRSKHEGIQR